MAEVTSGGDGTRPALAVASLGLADTVVVSAPPTAGRTDRRTLAWERFAPVIPAAIAVVTFAVLSAAIRNHFVEWDDQVVILGNHHYRGFAWSNLRWMFTTILMGHYVPVTWLTLALDYTLWGMDPAGYHLTNLLFHAANAALFYLLARRLIAAASDFGPVAVRAGAATAALFFAVHPLRAESVAWVTERRDVVSGFFFFLTLLGYLRARDTAGPTRRWLRLGSLACYVLAFLSKSMVMSLPVLLFILDMYPFRRVTTLRGWFAAAARPVRREKVPYVVLGAVAAMLGYYAQAANHFITPIEEIGWSARPALVAYSLTFYVSKTFLPLRLSPLYELPAIVHPLAPRFLGREAAVLAVTLVLILLRRRLPALLAAFAVYAVVLAPISGIVHSGYQLAHDRYSYLACLGWALVVGGATATLARAGHRKLLRPVFAAAGLVAVALWLVGIGTLGWRQVQAWHDTDTLWRFGLDSEPDCGVCLYNHAAMLYDEGHGRLAKKELERLLVVRPERVETHGELAIVLSSLGETDAAIRHFRIFLATKPDDAAAHNNLGVALRTVGRPRQALVQFEWAFHLDRDNPLVLVNLGSDLFDLGQRERGIALLERAARVAPDTAGTHLALGLADLVLGRREEAEYQYHLVRALDPRLVPAMAPALLTAW